MPGCDGGVDAGGDEGIQSPLMERRSKVTAAPDPCRPTRCRDVDVPGFGVLRVPRHISRCNFRSGGGFQVRFNGSRFFSDGLHGGPKGALRAARVHLRAIYEVVEKITRRGQRQGASAIEAGIALRTYTRRFQRASGATSVVQHFVEVTHPVRGHKRLYVGTDQTWTSAKQAQCLKKARAMRKQWLAAHERPIR